MKRTLPLIFFLFSFSICGFCQLNCALTYLTTIEGFNVYKHNASGAILYRAKFAVDADGSPRAYGPNNSGLDWTANAGYPGNWWGVVTDQNGDPVIQGSGDPYPGMYVSTTSLVQSGYATTNPLRYVNSEVIPYIALPSALQSLGNISKGDFAYAKNIITGDSSFAYFADSGPAGKLGEGSMFLATRVGLNSSPKTGGTSQQIIDYVVFPQSGFGQGTQLTAAQIDSIGEQVLLAAGGYGLPGCLDAQFTLNCSNTIPLTCGVTYNGTSSSAPSLVGTYGCNNWTESGPERVHSVIPSGNGTITATLSNFTGDLDVYILADCNPANCLGTVSSSSATYTNAIAGTTYYIVVDADDGSGSAYDLIVTCPASGSTEDITLTNAALSTAQVNAGDTFSVSVTQNYSGSNASSALPDFDLGFYLSTDCNLSIDDTLLGADSSDIGSDVPSGSESATLLIPASTASGNYYILFVADNNNELQESNEGNNIVCLSVTVNSLVLDCFNAVPLACGVNYHGASSAAASYVNTYGCNNWTETGPERIHTIVTQANGTLTASLSNFTGDLDVYILAGCDPANCVGTVSSSSATYSNAVAGVTYYIVVDADDGSGSAYDLVVTCPVNPCQPQTVNQQMAICNGDSIYLEGNYQNTAGTYYDTLQAVNGCDSVIETTLTINPTYSISKNAAICSGKNIFLQGAYQTTAGTYFDTSQSVNGCDSVIVTTLTVNSNPTVTVNSSDASCGSCCDGSANLSISGGSFPYMLQWDNNGFCLNCNTLCPGYYAITVTDSKGCSTVAGVGIDNTNPQVSSNCCTPTVLKTNYTSDVAHLAFNRILNLNSPYQDSIEIPQNFQDTIWEGLSAIFNLTNSIERDTVFDIYCIHQYPKIINNQIYVSVDTSYGWTQNWQNLNTTTGIAALDNLLANYGFTVTNFSTFGSNYATLTTTQNINVLPLCDSIELYAGVLYSEPKPYIGDGDHIAYNYLNGDKYYDFSIGYGDCQSGCIARRVFKFKVYSDCSVKFLGTNYGTTSEPFPGPINCNISSIPIEASVVICNGDSALVYGNYEMASGTYYDILQDASGCDSLVATVLTVNQIETSTIAAICNGDSIFLQGNFQTTAGTYYDTLQAVNGCDSVIVTTLTVNQSTVSSQQSAICNGDSIFLEGNFQTTAGTYYDTLQAVNGCDSIIETVLTVNSAFSIQYSVNICDGDSVFVGGNYQTTAGTYYDTLQSVNGCDSILETVLTVNSVFSNQYSVNICDGDSVFIGGNYQTTAGVYYDTLTSVNGCDSMIATTLIVISNPIDSISGTPDSTGIPNCTGTSTVLSLGPPVMYLWSDGQTTATATGLCAGNYFVTVTDANGCEKIDSVFVGSTVGEKESLVIGQWSLEIIPNPNGGKFNVMISQYDNVITEKMELKIYNVLGEEVYKKSFILSPSPSGERWGEVIDVSKVGSSVYYVQVLSEKGVLTKKVIIE